MLLAGRRFDACRPILPHPHQPPNPLSQSSHRPHTACRRRDHNGRSGRAQPRCALGALAWASPSSNETLRSLILHLNSNHRLPHNLTIAPFRHLRKLELHLGHADDVQTILDQLPACTELRELVLVSKEYLAPSNVVYNLLRFSASPSLRATLDLLQAFLPSPALLALLRDGALDGWDIKLEARGIAEYEDVSAAVQVAAALQTRALRRGQKLACWVEEKEEINALDAALESDFYGVHEMEEDQGEHADAEEGSDEEDEGYVA
jgi:hypothetical protein